jgi:hypothetical protein
MMYAADKDSLRSLGTPQPLNDWFPIVSPGDSSLPIFNQDRCLTAWRSRGIKASSSGRSIKSLIFGYFTLKISKNGNFWGLALFSRPPKGARPSVNRGGFILKPKAYIANALNFFAL